LQIGRLGHPRNNEEKTSFGSEGWFKLILLKRLKTRRQPQTSEERTLFRTLGIDFYPAAK